MTSRRDVIRCQIARYRRVLRPAMILTLVGFVASVITGITIGGAIGALTAAFTLCAVAVWVYAVVSIWLKVRCPCCRKRLGYLLLDPSYSRTFAPVGMPKDIPATVTECPYCHADLEEETTAPVDLQH